jgi:hypothetical protein
MPVIPATLEVKTGGYLCTAGLGKSVRAYLKNKLRLGLQLHGKMLA